MSVYERDLLVRGRRVHLLDSGASRTPPRTHARADSTDDRSEVHSASGLNNHSADGRDTPPFVLFHGLGGCSRHWLRVMPALAEHSRVIALDLPGFGASEASARPVSLDGLADVVSEVVALLELGPVVLVGHSFAGPVALRFAARHPELATGLVLAGGAVFQFSALLGLHSVPRFLRTRPRETIAIFAEVLSAGLPLPAAVRRAIARSSPLRRLTLWPYVRDPGALSIESATLLLDGAGAHGVFSTVRAVAGSDPLERIDSVRCPILSLGGECDLIVPLADIRELQSGVPQARTFVFEGCGHMAMLERPQAFVEQVLVFAEESTISQTHQEGASQ